jgi:hypothetical protein
MLGRLVELEGDNDVVLHTDPEEVELEGDNDVVLHPDPEEEEGDIGVMDLEGSFLETFQMQGVAFRVHCANQGMVNNLTITASGRGADDTPVVREVDGTVGSAAVGDLDGDGWPEIYVFATSGGSGSYGAALGFVTGEDGALTEIGIPESPPNDRGYMGHDRYAVRESFFVRSFPIYRESDTNSRPTGGVRNVTYRLTVGDVGQPVLHVQDVTDSDGS